MTILTEHPWMLVFYLLAVLLQLAVTLLPKGKLLGLVSALYHGAAVVVFCLFGGTLEDVLLFLLFSLTVGLVLGYLFPCKRKTDNGEKKEEHK